MGRYGGEEFLGILPDCDLQSSLSIAERLRTNVQNRVVHHEGQGLCVTISIGVASIFKTNDEMVEDLIAHADEALYRAKHNGRNCVVHF
jgi:diguanylate cyclase (GGDEF)-like protein